MQEQPDRTASLPVLAVRSLTTSYETPDGTIRAVDNVSFDLHRGEILGIVGESGSGKSTLALSLLRLVPPPGRIEAGELMIGGRNVLALSPSEMRQVRGREMAVIFQNPMRSLHFAFAIGWQLSEALRAHDNVPRKNALVRIVDALRAVGIPDAKRRAHNFPHQLSGGMQQRVMIALSLMNNPQVLIADEPTTALDVTIQAQILELLKELAVERHMAVILVTHNLGVVASICDRMLVMYAGQVVEEGKVEDVFSEPHHPYTLGLLNSLPERVMGDRLPTIKGTPPTVSSRLPVGCRFRPRCDFAEEICYSEPQLRSLAVGRRSRCWVSQHEGTLKVANVSM
ncbi:MAG TPA: peptide ABC transporter ATP-binding protein [Chloroflexi bacterium]|nr:peptide ABC transporter ATP-binding protein [Chloroflexota bacterium]